MKKVTAVFLVACVTLGFLAGLNVPRQRNTYIINNTDNKLGEVLNNIQARYVDETDIDSIIEKSIPKVLEELDPHSVYIPVKDVENSNADLQSSFSGIGIRFTIQEDTLHINDVIRSGPSEKVGMLAGDRIIKINDTLFVGKGVCTNDAALKKLKGKKGSFVKLSVERYGEKDLLDFNIRRDDIPVESIEATYMINGKWGYVQVERFAENTFAEFIQALALFMACNAKGIIIDLRGNGGGYMGVALEMANQFLDRDEMIVYTEGFNSPKNEERANGYGMFKKMPLVVLVDETSASASEILAGTIQDNDRGTIIGRRTFGKGLVQQPIELKDGSSMRLTIARYYTPSGRCIQKPYTKGDNKEYAMDLIERYNRGEFFSKDSIHFNDSLIYKTRNGRIVYGGGGIMPDYFVPIDTTLYSDYHRDLVAKGVVIKTTLNYIEKNRKALTKSYRKFDDFNRKFEVSNELLDELRKEGEKSGVAFNETEYNTSLPRIKTQLKALIARDIWEMSEYYQVMNQTDNVVQQALKIIEKED